jgi:hypothetical protein
MSQQLGGGGCGCEIMWISESSGEFFGGKLTFRSLAASIVALLCAGIGIADSFCVRKLKPMVTVQVAASQQPRICVDGTGFINGKCNGF